MQNEIARVQAQDLDVLQENGIQRIAIGVMRQRQQRIAALLRLRDIGRGRDIAKLPEIDGVQVGVEIDDSVLNSILAAGGLEYELIDAAITCQRVGCAACKDHVIAG